MFNPKFSGKIPKGLKYVMRAPSVARDYWEHDIFDGETMGRDVRETFVIDADSKESLATAIRWAGENAEITECPNAHIPELELVSLEKRNEGGRAWKVLIGREFYVDLREDVLLDALRNGTGVKDAILKGPFLWCSIAGRLKLVRVGSKLHEAVIAADKRHNAPAAKKSALEVGGIYENKRGERYVYLGQVDTERLSDEANPERPGYGTRVVCPSTWVRAEVRNQQLWGHLRKHLAATVADLFKPMEHVKEEDPWLILLFEVVKNKTVGAQVGREEVPADHLALIRAMTTDGLARYDSFNKKKAAEFFKYRGCQQEPDPYHRLNRMAYYSEKAFLREVGEPAPSKTCVDELLRLAK